MTINVADNTPRVSYSVAEGVTQTSFTVSFEFFNEADLNVYVDGTLKTLTTDYTVSGGNGSTGTVTISVTGATGGSTVVITRDIALERTTDFPASGAFQIGSLNTELDKLIAITADLDDKASRALQLTDYDTAVSLVLPDVDTRKGKTLAFNATSGAVEAGPTISDVQTVSAAAADIATLADIEDGTDATDAIQTVAGISSNVTTVAGISGNVTTVAGISSDVTAVAADATDIGTVATNIASVNTVATNINDVIAVANDLNEAISEVETVANDLNEAVSEIDTVATSITNVDTVGTNIANVNTVAGNNANITTVAGISGNVTTVAGISSNVTTVAGISSDVTTVAADGTDIGTVATNIANVNTVAGIDNNVTTVAGISGNVTTVSGISSNVTTVAGVSSDVTTVAGQISPTNNVGTVAGIASDVSTVSGVSANVTTVAGNTTNINTVAGISGNVTTVAGISSDVTAVAADATDIGTVATNLAGTDTIGTVATNISNVNTVAGISSNVTTVAGISSDVTAVAADSTDIGTVATNIANVNTVGGSISNVNTVATNISSVNDFADKYRIGASDPTTNNDEGDLFYNTTSDTLKVYTGTAWEQGVTAGSGFLALTGGTMTGDINFGDNDKAVFGAGSDLQIYHDGLNSYVDEQGSGGLLIRGTNLNLTDSAGVRFLRGESGGPTRFYHQGTEVLTSTSSGIDVTGTVTADGLTVSTDGYRQLLLTYPDAFTSKLQLGFSNFYVQGSVTTDELTIANNSSGQTKFINQSKASLLIDNSNDISFYDSTGVTQGFFWDASEVRLGLGTTSPARNLHLYAENADASVRLQNTANSKVWEINPSIPGVANSGLSVVNVTDNTVPLHVNNSGNVGIGTASIDNKLHLEHAGTLYLQIENTSTANKFYVGNSGGSAILESTGAYSMNFKTNSTERMRLDASGNLLVGKTSASVANDGIQLEASGTLGVTRANDDVAIFNRKSSDGNIAVFRKDNTTVGSIGTYAGDLQLGGGDTGIRFVPATDDVIPWNPSTNNAKDNAMDLGNATNRFKNGYFSNSVLASNYGSNDDPDTYINFPLSNIIRFYTGGSERARLDASGNFLVGASSTSSTDYGAKFIESSTISTILAIHRQASDGDVAQFSRGGISKGSISVAGAGTTYNTTSDIRLKENIEPLVATDKLMAMNPVSYNWKADPDGPRSMGFIAQEMQEVMPEAVAVGDDEDAMMSMDYGRITPVLVAALQDAHRKIEQLEQRIADMEAK